MTTNCRMSGVTCRVILRSGHFPGLVGTPRPTTVAKVGRGVPTAPQVRPLYTPHSTLGL
jgi:hypothetical protein